MFKKLKSWKKGFSLLELLAVILILAIIIVIVVPIVINVMDTARRGALESTAWGIVKTAEQDYLKKRVQRELTAGDRTIVFGENEMVIGRLDFSGQIPKYGEVIIHEKGRVSLAIHDGKYCAEIYPGEHVVYISEKSYVDCRITVGDSIDDLINQGYIPIANAIELNNIRYSVENIFGLGTEWEGTYLGGLDKKYVQVDHLDLEEYLSDKPNGWTPLGTREHCDDDEGDDEDVFSGIYNGFGFRIDNLFINSDEYSGGIGLFGTINGAILENIEIVDSNIIRIDGGGRVPIGTLVGFVMGDGIEIKNVNISGDVIAAASWSSAGGGLIGAIMDAKEIKLTNIVYQGNVFVENASVGGIIGLVRRYENLDLHNVHFVGDVTANDGAMIGGMIGEATNQLNRDDQRSGLDPIPAQIMQIRASSVNGDIKLDESNRYSRVAGIIGTVNTLEELILDEIDFTGNVYGKAGKVSGVIGWLSEIDDAHINNINIIGDIKSEEFRLTNKTGGVIGSLTFYEKVLIQDIFREGETSSETWNKVGGIIGEATYATTIGYHDMNRADIPYRAAQSLIIRNIIVNGDVIGNCNKLGGIVGSLGHTDYVEVDNIFLEGDIINTYNEGRSIGGLIGRIFNSETLIVSNSDIKSNIIFTDNNRKYNDVSGYIGRIGGVMNITFENTHYSGNIMNSEYFNSGSVGGLIGRITAGGNKTWWVDYDYLEDVDYFLNIKDSSVNATLYGTGTRIGGLVGFVHEDEGNSIEFPGVVTYVTIENSYFKGEINVQNIGRWHDRIYLQAGGLVGDSKDTVIKNSYVIADINASIISGSDINCTGNRLIGELDDHSISGIIGNVRDRAELENVYFAGTINIDKDGVLEPPEDYNRLKPITTFPDLTLLTNTYYDINLLNINDALALGKTTNEMKQQSTYTSWDFNNVWKIDSAINNGYPHLHWE